MTKSTGVMQYARFVAKLIVGALVIPPACMALGYAIVWLCIAMNSWLHATFPLPPWWR